MKVTVVTQVYNGIDYVPETIESILKQTHSDLEFIIVDDGSTDGIEKVIDEYAESDSRIKVKRFKENGAHARWPMVVAEMGTGDFVAHIDSDDIYEPTFVERMLKVIDETGVDIITTGTYEFDTDTGVHTPLKQSDNQVVIEKKDYAKYYKNYHWFYIFYSAKLIRMDIFKKTQTEELSTLTRSVSLCHIDTVYTFAWLRNCQKIGIDNSVLHGKRYRADSAGNGRYDKFKFFLDVYLYNDALDFLSAYGTISQDNKAFINRIYYICIAETAKMVNASSLSPEDKMKEYRKILEHDITLDIIKTDNQDFILEHIKYIIIQALTCAAKLADENEDWCSVKTKYFPKCSSAVSPKTAKLFTEDKTLLDYLLNDYRKPMVKYIVSLIEKQIYTKQYDLGEVINKLSTDKPIVNEITDKMFLKNYGDVFMLVWNEKYSEALDLMTDMLLKKLEKNETFYEVYLSLAASLECVNEFVFGKIKQSHYYCNEGDKKKASELLNDVAEMGVEDNDEIIEIKQKIIE